MSASPFVRVTIENVIILLDIRQGLFMGSLFWRLVLGVARLVPG